MNFRMIFNILGWILLFEAGFLVLPAAVSLLFGEWQTVCAFLLYVNIRTKGSNRRFLFLQD